MISIWIWALILGTLLPGTVATFWLVHRYGGHLLSGGDRYKGHSSTGDSVSGDDEGSRNKGFSGYRLSTDELTTTVHVADGPSFEELSASEIDDIIEYYENRSGHFARSGH